MEIRMRESGQVMFEDEFRRLHQGLGLPTPLTQENISDWGADIVLEGPQASGGTVYQYSMRQGVQAIDGLWYTKYVLGPIFTDTPAQDDTPAKTAAENETAYRAMKDAEQAKSVRASRDDKLKSTDWTQVSDAPVDKTVWATYRQALRDLPSAAGFPWSMEWPTEPTGA